MKTNHYNSTQMQQSAVGTRRGILTLLRGAGKGNTNKMTFQLSFENEPDLLDRGHSRLKNEHEQRHGGLHLGVSEVVSGQRWLWYRLSGQRNRN